MDDDRWYDYVMTRVRPRESITFSDLMALVNRLYDIEERFVDTDADADVSIAILDELAAILDPHVGLLQSRDLPYGGEYRGIERYKQWLSYISLDFDKVKVKLQSSSFSSAGSSVTIM